MYTDQYEEKHLYEEKVKTLWKILFTEWQAVRCIFELILKFIQENQCRLTSSDYFILPIFDIVPISNQTVNYKTTDLISFSPISPSNFTGCSTECQSPESFMGHFPGDTNLILHLIWFSLRPCVSESQQLKMPRRPAHHCSQN